MSYALFLALNNRIDLHIAFETELRIKWVPCHHGMAHSVVAVREHDLQICKVLANILKKKSRGQPTSCGPPG
jgi:hypothetical protein